MTEEIHVGNEGTALKITFKEYNDSGALVILNISTAIAKQATIRKPNGVEIPVTLAFYTNGTDGIGVYYLTASDLDQPGDYQAQGYVELPGGKWHTSIEKFTVKANL